MPTYKATPYKGFGGGLNLRDGVDLVAEDQALDAMNVVFNTRGVVQQRSGYGKFSVREGTNRYDSLSPFYKSDGTKQLLAGAGNRLEAITSAGSVLASSTAPTASPHYFQRFGGPTAEHIYIANGTDPVRRWTGAAFEVPVYVGTTPSGRFLGLSVTDNRLVNARFPGSTAGNNPSTVRFSAEGDPLTWGTTHYVDLTPGDGEQIMGIATWRDQVIVFKQSKFFVFYGQSVDDEGEPVFNYRPVDAGVGLVSSRAIAVAEQGIYFLDRTGIYFTTGGQPSRVSEAVEPIFQGGQSVYYTGGVLNDGSIDMAVMTYHDERLYLGFPAGVSATNDRLLVFDPHEKWWTLFNIPAGALTVFRPGHVDELVFAYASGEKHLGRYVQGQYLADNVGEVRINLAPNPKAEINTNKTSLASVNLTSVALTRVAQAWHAGSGFAYRSTGTHNGTPGQLAQLRFQAIRSGVNGEPFSAGQYATASAYVNTVAASVDTFSGYRWVIVFADAAGGTLATHVQTSVPDEGVVDQRISYTTPSPAPANTAFIHARIEQLSTTPTEVITFEVTEILVEAKATLDTYFDGTDAGASWLGVAHESHSATFVPDVGGNAIEAFWQSGWFTYGTPAVKTIRESKLAGSGLVTVQMYRDYRQSPSISKAVELSPPTGIYDAGLLYDSGIMYGPSGGISPKSLRKAIRGEAFSIRFYNNTFGRAFKVHRFTTHLREVRIPSVVKVN